MRILLIADIHSNWPALAAIEEKFDACLFLGDVVDYATDPVPCIEWVQRYATAFVRGITIIPSLNESTFAQAVRFGEWRRKCVLDTFRF